MRTYAVYVRDLPAGAACAVTAVPQGFSPAWALFAAPLALARGHWAAAAGYAAAFAAVWAGAGFFAPPVPAAVMFCFFVLQGLTAADVRGWALLRAGHRIEGWGAWPDADAAAAAVLAADPVLAEDAAAGLGIVSARAGGAAA